MLSVNEKWNPKQKRLKEIIRKSDCYEEAKELFLEMHGLVHFSEVTSMKYQSFFDILLEGTEDKDYSIMPTEKDETIAWIIWHITRIEDITINILVNNSNQVLNQKWLENLNINITDTGNAMTDEEIIYLSKSLNKQELINYRNAVGKRTQEILKSLNFKDMKRKIDREGLNRILDEGGVTQHPNSIWLLDFWGKKDVAGIILMPITRHQVGHMNECLRLKDIIKRRKSFYCGDND